MSDIKFTVDKVDYVAHLSTGYITINGKDRKTCNCIISMINPIRTFSGVAIKNPNDDMKFEENCGYHLAFKRAIFQTFLVVEVIKNISVTKRGLQDSVVNGWVTYWHKFRVPFGKALHEWYLEDSNFPF